MPKRRDRHSRGLRGPLSVANPITGEEVPARRRESPVAFFIGSVEAALERIRNAAPRALDNVTVGVEDVPTLTDRWQGEPVPLAAATEATDRKPAQIVVYRRPLELRAASRRELDDLVHRTIVEQLAEITNLDARSIDPDYDRDA